ncbi:WGR domain-containing protein [Agrobacterium rhizogenes]|nr:WGR domain-containing protein [Rhizobium rhizogenes]NTJ81247.1 WGR domain-containing protein [Rhizobium rhizogenes]
MDAAAEINDSQIMISQPYQLYVERTDEARNMARFYAMTIELNLFGEICLTRRWGRIGAHGQTKVQPFASERDAVAVFLDLLRQKRSRGYRTVASAARYPAFLPEKGEETQLRGNRNGPWQSKRHRLGAQCYDDTGHTKYGAGTI